jgi:hypothetical protein
VPLQYRTVISTPGETIADRACLSDTWQFAGERMKFDERSPGKQARPMLADVMGTLFVAGRCENIRSNPSPLPRKEAVSVSCPLKRACRPARVGLKFDVGLFEG